MNMNEYERNKLFRESISVIGRQISILAGYHLISLWCRPHGVRVSSPATGSCVACGRVRTRKSSDALRSANRLATCTTFVESVPKPRLGSSQ